MLGGVGDEGSYAPRGIGVVVGDGPMPEATTGEGVHRRWGM
jgi:hypothetical protein